MWFCFLICKSMFYKVKVALFGILKSISIVILLFQCNTYANQSIIKALYTGPKKNFLSFINTLKTLNLNALVIDIKDDHGETVFNKKSPRYIPNLQKQIKILKENNIYLIARIVTFKDKNRVTNYPSSSIKTKNNSIFIDKEKTYWLNPYNKENWQYIKDIITKSSEYGFDEIQLDYIRFSPYLNQEDFIRYNPEFLIYKNSINIISTAYSNQKNKYTYSIYDKISPELISTSHVLSRNELLILFLTEIANFTKSLNIKLSVDVFGCVIPGSFRDYLKNSKSLGQDYVEFSKIVDFISPMIYPSHYTQNSMKIKKPDLSPYNIIFKSMKYSNKYISKSKTRPWIQAFTASWLKKGNYQKYSKQQLVEQIEALEKNGIFSYCIWNPKGNYNDFLH